MDEASDKPAASVRAADLWTAVILFVIGCIVIKDSLRLGAKWGDSGPESGYFPFYIGMLLCASSVANFLLAWFKRRHETFVSKESFKGVVSVFVPTVVYVGLIGGVGPVPGLGIYVASAVFIACFMRLLGKYGWGTTAGVALGVPLAFFLLFEKWFRVPLPKGPLEALLGLA
ncbi:MAG: tripartite tricarboxylate transporter TctB family protein [Betaproteobacteria bacterium]|nr:tripartite tricarboxylate transporter TctB family protein [Betaproteobacteria bacterium]